MKKSQVVLLILVGFASSFKGILGFFNLEFSSISNNNVSYNLGHNFGIVFEKVIFIAFGIMILIKAKSIYFNEIIKSE
jgi:hypothetical protein